MKGSNPSDLGFRKVQSVNVDERGRIAVGKLFKKSDGPTPNFAVYLNDIGQIMLDPVVEIPVRERWIFKNPKALKNLRAGLDSGATEKPVSRGSFAKFSDDEED